MRLYELLKTDTDGIMFLFLLPTILEDVTGRWLNDLSCRRNVTFFYHSLMLDAEFKTVGDEIV